MIDTTNNESSGILKTAASVTSAKKDFSDHVTGVLATWKPLMGTSIAVLGAFWLVIAFTSYSLKIDLSGWTVLAFGTGISLAAGCAHALRTYVSKCPGGFENESLPARRIAHFQPRLWEFKLTHQLLGDKLRALDQEHARLIAGRELVAIEKQLDIHDYINWIQPRIASVERMAQVLPNLLVPNLSAAISNPGGSASRARAILSTTNQIRDFYKQTVDFERANHAVAPPDAFETLHRLQRGWTDVIRGGVKQVTNQLQSLEGDVNPRISEIHIHVEVDAPKYLDAFCDEIARLEPQIEGFILDETGLSPRG